ncbi:Multidrug/Oligosaccharidyl-lipid/Polysaccharide (MOP) Flippase Superfamily [Thraustotheca clavata]|uniref:Multidrug/Oligosaccharidyl-lipid/Polysaccharide (MOP) Flippase Superfamily n=1 Tax=Thraustotheca clavata TaxID=74557 RepID=A0A1W0A0I1_9STRA|nr:Multidrug/Oligosaccharidyl-lipid/Polysaccharide (MOP) Flippase Superfamily [Thraustotheca clavata]
MERFKELDKQRAALEAEAAAIVEELTSGTNPPGLKGPLVDAEGFPRSDIDVYMVRHKRHRFACLQTDISLVMKEIEDVMAGIYAESKPKQLVSAPETKKTSNVKAMKKEEKEEPLLDKVDDLELLSMPPFALVDTIQPDSPASEAGLEEFDSIVAFGSANATNHRELKAIREIVMRNINKPIQMVLNESKALLSEEGYDAPNILEEWWSLVGLSGPVILTLLMEYLPCLTNVVLVGQMNSPDTKAFVDAASISGMYLNITSISVGLGMATAMDTLCTQAFGAGQTKKFGIYLQGAILSIGVILIPVSLLDWYAEDILLLLGQDSEISALAGTFTKYTTLGLPFLFFYELVKKLLQAYNIVVPTAIMSILSNVIHVVVGYYLTNYTSLGFYGAGLARSISYITLPLMMVPYFICNPLHREWELRFNLSQALGYLPEIFIFGIPGMLMMMMEWTAFELLTLFTGLMPDPMITIGVNSILMNIISIVYMIFMGISVSVNIRIGNMLGANKPHHAKLIMLMGYGLCCVGILFTCSFIYFGRYFIPNLFLHDPQVTTRASSALLYVLPCHIVDALNANSQGVLRGMGHQQIATYVNAAAFYLVGIPVAALCAFYYDLSVEGLWAGFTTGPVLACCTYLILLVRVKWHEVSIEARTLLIRDPVRRMEMQAKEERVPSISQEWSMLLSIAGPIIVTLALEYLPAITNVVLAGQMPRNNNTEAYVSAAAMSSMYVNVTSIAVALGMATALDILCTQAIGAGSTSKFGFYLQSSLLGFLITFVPMCIANYFAEELLLFLGQEPFLAGLVGRLTWHSTLGIPFLFLFEVLKKMLQTYNVMLPSALAVVFSNVIHITLGYYLTQHTSIGLDGLAIARSVAYIFLPLVLIVYLKYHPYHHYWNLQWSLSSARSHLRQFFRYGVPGMLMMQLEWGALELLILISGILPNTLINVSVNSIFVNLISFLYIIFMGLSIAVNLRIGNMLGGNKPRHAIVNMQLAYGVCILASCLTCLLMYSSRTLLPTLFISDPNIVRRVTDAMLFVIPLHFLDALNVVSQGVLRGMGRPGFATCVTVLGYYIVGLPLASYAAFYLNLSIEGLWVGFALGLLLAFAVYFVLLKHVNWNQMAREAIARTQELSFYNRMAGAHKEEKQPLVKDHSDHTLCIHAKEENLPDPKEEWWHLVTLAGPVIFTLLMEYIPSSTNIVLVGQMNSNMTKEYVDAAAISGMYLTITSLSVGLGMSTAMDTLCNQAAGAGHTYKFGVYLQAALLGLSLVFVPVFILNWFCGHILVLLGQDYTISHMAGAFTRMTIPGLPFLFVYEILKKMIQAHDIVMPMLFMTLLSNVFHVGIGYYLVHHTELGFYGASIARSIAYISLLIMMIPYFYINPLYKQWELNWSYNDAREHLWQFFRFGLPGMFMLMFEYGAFEILTLLSGLMPNDVLTIGVNSIMTNTVAIIYMIYFGIATSANIRVGNMLGGNKPHHAEMIMKMAYQLCLACTFVTGAFIFLARGVLPYIFINDPEVIARATTAIIFIIPLHMSDAMNAVSQGVLQAMGQQHIATITNGCAYYMVGIPTACLIGFYFNFSVEGLWCGFTLGSISACTVYYFVLSRVNWTKMAQDAVLQLLSSDEKPNVMEEAKILFGLAGPVMFTLFMEVLPTTTNMILVGQMNSENTKEYVDASSLSGLYVNITAISAGLGLSTAMDTLCTQAFGAGNLKKFGGFLQGALLGMGLMLIPIFILNWFTEDILLALGQHPKIAALAGEFTRMTMVGLPFFFVFELLKKMLQAYHIVHPMAFIVVLGNIIHISLGYYLVQFTSYGFYGAAIARSVSYIALPLMMIPLFIYNPVHKEWDIHWSLQEAKQNLPEFFQYGVPGMLMMVIEWGAFEFLTLMAGMMPDAIVDIGIMSILSQILTITYLIYMGISCAATIRVGNMAGANKPLHAKAIVKISYILCVISMIFVVGALILLRHSMPSWFIKDAEIIELTSYVLLFTLPGHIVDGINAVSQGIFRATGKQNIATIINAAAFYIFGVPLAALVGLYLKNGVEGLWIGYFSGSFTAFVLYLIILYRLDWPKLTLDISLKHIDI